MKNPIQPLFVDHNNAVRFKENKIVRYLLDAGGIDLNQIARIDFPQEDREQFAQLIGYSLSGFGELSYVTDETYEAARIMAQEGASETEARIAALEETIRKAREGVRDATVALFPIHQDDLPIPEAPHVR